MSFRTQSVICVIWVNEHLLYTNTGRNRQTMSFLCRLKKFNVLMVLSLFIGSKPILAGTVLPVEVRQQTDVVILLLTPLEPRRRQLSPIRLWLCVLCMAKHPYKNFHFPGLLSALITSFSTTPIRPH
jgi:hypothetical protein